MSQNPCRRRGPHRAASPGHVPRLRGTRTELRGRQLVRRSRAAPRRGAGSSPAGERRRNPRSQGGQRLGRRIGSGTPRAKAGNRSRDGVWGPEPRILPTLCLPGANFPQCPGERALRAGRRSANAPSFACPLPTRCLSLSLSLRYRLSFLLFTAIFFFPHLPQPAQHRVN